jgi:hypothetical protein
MPVARASSPWTGGLRFGFMPGTLASCRCFRLETENGTPPAFGVPRPRLWRRRFPANRLKKPGIHRLRRPGCRFMNETWLPVISDSACYAPFPLNCSHIPFVEERRARGPESRSNRTFHHFPLTAGVGGGAWPGLAAPVPGFFWGFRFSELCMSSSANWSRHTGLPVLPALPGAAQGQRNGAAA